MASDFDVDRTGPGRVVRPYVLTRGRTEPSALLVETMVVATTTAPDAFADESRRLVHECREPVAIAELAARVDLPYGIVKVLVADLVEGGHLEAFGTAAPDDAMTVRRILDGIRAT